MTPDFDPLSDDFTRDPHATWARLRATCPVARGARWDFWALTRYDDIIAASSRPADFTSSHGIVVPTNPVSGRRAPLHFDPPEHPRYRRPLNAMLRDDTICRARAAAFARSPSSCSSRFVARGGGEVVLEVSVAVRRARLRGVPATAARAARASSTRTASGSSAAQAHFDVETAERENQPLYAACRELVAERREAPLDPRAGIVSALLASVSRASRSTTSSSPAASASC